MADPNLSELTTTTLQNRQESLRDAVTNNNILLSSMKKNGGFSTEAGGRTLVEEFAYAENGTFTRYSGGQVLDTSFNYTMSAAEFDWKQFAIAVVVNGLEERQNSGPEGLIKLLSSRIQIAEYTLENKYNSDMLSDGTEDGGKQIGGLKLIVAKTPTNTVGGIDRSVSGNAFWKNFSFKTDTDTIGGAVPGTITSSNIKPVYNYTINKLTRGSDLPKMILAGQTHYEALQSAMQAIQRVTNASDDTIGRFPHLMYGQGIPVYMGGGVSFGGESLVSDDASYFLNTRYLKMRVHRDANMEPLPDVQSINQDAKVRLIIHMANMTCSVAKLQGVVYDT